MKDCPSTENDPKRPGQCCKSIFCIPPYLGWSCIYWGYISLKTRISCMSGDLALRRLHFDPWFCLQDLGAAGKAKVPSTCRCGGWKWLGTECEEKQTHLESAGVFHWKNYEKLIGKGAVAFLRIHPGVCFWKSVYKILQPLWSGVDQLKEFSLVSGHTNLHVNFVCFWFLGACMKIFLRGLIVFYRGLGCWISWIRLTSLRNSQVYVTIRGLSMWVGVFSILATSRHWPSLDTVVRWSWQDPCAGNDDTFALRIRWGGGGWVVIGWTLTGSSPTVVRNEFDLKVCDVLWHYEIKTWNLIVKKVTNDETCAVPHQLDLLWLFHVIPVEIPIKA